MSGVSEGSWECEVRAGCPRHYSRWVEGWAWLRPSAGSSLQRLTSRPPEVFLYPSLREEVIHTSLGTQSRLYTNKFYTDVTKGQGFMNVNSNRQTTHHVLGAEPRQ